MLQSKTVKGLSLVLLLGVSAQSQALSWNDLLSYLSSSKTVRVTAIGGAVALVGILAWHFWPRKLQKLQNIICDNEVMPVPLAWNLLSYTPDLNVQCERLEDGTVLVSYVDSFADNKKKVLFYVTHDSEVVFAGNYDVTSAPAFYIKKQNTDKSVFIYRSSNNEHEQNKLFDLLLRQLPKKESSFACSSS